MSKKQIIHFTDEAYQDLRDYVTAKYGKHRAISFVVQQAVEQFLQREAAREEAVEQFLRRERAAGEKTQPK